MLGFNSAESNKLTDERNESSSCNASGLQNILYTERNSGYYADGNPATSDYDKLFVND